MTVPTEPGPPDLPSRVERHGFRALRVRLASHQRPEQAVLWLRGDQQPVALVGDWAGMNAVLSSDPLRGMPPGEDPFSRLDELPALSAEAAGVAPAGTAGFDDSPGGAPGGFEDLPRGAPGGVRVGGGWFGWLGYGLGSRIERLPPPPPAPVSTPGFSLAFYDHVVLYDGEQWWFEALWSPGRDATLRRRLSIWRTRLGSSPAPPGTATPGPFRLAANGAAGHLAAVEACRQRIAEGELFQANLCVRLEASFAGDAAELLARALAVARPRFGALVGGLVSLSPERFLRREGRHVWTEPIKGTTARIGEAAAQRAALAALLASRKDAAEHVMIVDLMRNDLGRVCAYGTIVAEPPRAEPHAGVWHLVSTVSGQLRAGVGNGELLRATFPPGSVTGAPKIQAMKVITELEATRREAYTGAIGLASPIAGLDLSVAIRTFELRQGSIWLGVGGGIVADSDPAAELAEALAKAAGPIAAIGARAEIAPARPERAGQTERVGPAERAGRRARIPAALKHGVRPDPAAGIFETILVSQGRPVDGDAHLARLAASLAEVYGLTLPATVATRMARAAARAPARARMRVRAIPDAPVEITVTPAGGPPRGPAALIPFMLPGGLGAHKWSDRGLLDALSAAAPGAIPLLVDSDGLVLEAAYANVWIAEGSALLTPAADGRILAGVTRAGLLAAEPSARECPIELARLAAADAIFLTSSIAGRHDAVFAPV